MIKDKIAYLVSFIILLTRAYSYSTSDPIWLPSPYFRAGNDKVISTMTGNDSMPTYTFTFSSALSGVPNLAYGIKNYRGNDTLLNEMFQIRRVSLTASTFTVSMQIFGFTNIFLLTVPYLAIDRLFPHHLNSFDNVPLNYSSGLLTNFSVESSTAVYHTETINYTQQSAANVYKTFQNPLSSNRIVLFVSSFFVIGSGTATSFFPVQMDINYTILNSSHYKWTARIFQNATVTRIHFSQIVYNQDDVTASKVYTIVYKEWTVNASGGYQAFPQQLVGSMILALTDFRSINGRCGLQYNWDFIANFSNTSYGIKIDASLPTNYDCGFSQARSTLFYLKTWQCKVPYIYFNLTNDKCQSACGDYYYDNQTAKICDPCYYSCIDCSKGNDSNFCSTCETGLKRTLVNSTCVCDTGYFDDGYSPSCRACSTVDANCLICEYALNSSNGTSYYQTLFSSVTWSSDILPNYTCSSCMTNYFINASALCQACPLNYCLTCTNLTACFVCNSSTLAVKYTNNLCYLCNVSNCVMCSADNFCSSCNTGYILTSGLCLLCNQSCTCSGWVLPKVNGTCSTLCGDGYKVGTEQCDDGNTNDHDGCSSTCQNQICSVSCLCDGWIYPFVNTSCSTTCGDLLIRRSQQCDDGNLNNHDGCSSTCQNQICSISCLCDGWIHPFINNSCTSVCGDNLLRGTEQCDDGNLDDHDGCSSTCLTEPCNVSCLCDGWTHPFTNGSCKTICGDGLKRGDQQCDDKNLINGDKCDINCLNQVTIIRPVIEQVQEVLIKQQYTEYFSLFIFALGFRIVGIEMLNVFQSFQLILKSKQVQPFQFSFNIHGYTDSERFPFQIPMQNHMFTHFNFMFLAILVLLMVSASLQICGLCVKKSNKVKNIFKDNARTKDKQTSSESNSDNVEDFAVHYNKKDQKNHLQTMDFNESTIVKEPESKSCLTILFRQIFYDLMINCQYIFIYSMVRQIKYAQIGSLLDFNSLLIVGCMLVLLLTILTLCSIESPFFGQNQLKFHPGKWMIYWILTVAQRVAYAALLAHNQFWDLYAILGLKLILIVYLGCNQIFCQKIQKRRNIVVHILHFWLVLLFVLDQNYLKAQKTFHFLPKFFIQYVYLCILGAVFLITIAFYVRELMFRCQADYKHQHQSLVMKTQQKSGVSYLFDAKHQSESSHPFNYARQDLKSSNIFDQLKSSQSNKSMALLYASEKKSYGKAKSKSKKVISGNFIKYLKEANYLQQKSGDTKKSYQTHKRSSRENNKVVKTFGQSEDQKNQKNLYDVQNQLNIQQHEQKLKVPHAKGFMNSMRRPGHKNKKKQTVQSKNLQNSYVGEKANKSEIYDPDSQNGLRKQLNDRKGLNNRTTKLQVRTYQTKNQINILNTKIDQNSQNNDDSDAVSINLQ